MTPNPKRRRRILVIAVVGVALAATAGGGYLFRQSQLDRRARDARDAGRAAFAAKDYPAALNGLGRFLQRLEREEGTAEDLCDYAEALHQVQQANSGHIHDAIGIYRKALDKDPACRRAQDALLRLYADVGWGTEALDLLESMIAQHPDELALLREKRDWLEAQRRFAAGFEVAKLVNARDPADFDGFVRAWALLTRSEAPVTDVTDWMDSVISTHPSDPRFELLRAAEHARRGEKDEAKDILDRSIAGGVDARDPRFVAFLVNQLDAADRFGDALAVLEKLGDDVAVPLRVELCRRLWYAGRVKDVADRTERLAREGGETDPEALALRILVLRNLDRAADAEPARRMLAAHDEQPWKAWQAFVTHVVDGRLAGGRAAVDDLTAAMSAVPGNAILLKAHGDALAKLGETDAAIRSWAEAAGRAPSWAAPSMSIARALPPARGPEAGAAARAALKRAPNDPDAIATFVEVAARNADVLDARHIQAMLAAVDRYRTAAPEQAAELLPAQVGLMLRTDKSEAERRLRAAVAEKTSASERTFLRLAQIAFETGVPLETEFLDLSEAAHGVTPQLALARALVRARSGSYAAALREFDELRQRRAAGTVDLDWDLLRAGLLDAAQMPDAAASWIAIVDANPESLPAHLGALASPAVWRDRGFTARVIERVRALTGDDGATWRTARARWLLSVPGASDGEVTEAAAVLEQVTRAKSGSLAARILHAQALERLGKLPQAQEQLLAAADLAPDNAWVALELARLAQRAGDPDLAQRQLDRALRSKDLPPEQTERAAYMLAVQGDVQRSAELLEPLAARAQSGPEGQLLLAKLYAKMGQSERALALCSTLLATSSHPDVLALGAELNASLGRNSAAVELLAQLDRLALPPGDREAICARHLARWGTPAAACELYARAVSAAPGRTDLWNEYLTVALLSGDPAVVARALDDPKSAAVEPVVHLNSIRALCTTALADERLRPLLVAAAVDPASRNVLADVLRKVTEAWSDPARREETARAVRSLADANARILPLQIASARLSADAGDLRGAGEVASRAAATFPDSVEASFRAYESYARSGKWDEALSAALKWRDRAEGGDLGPEVAVARMRLRLNRPVDATTGLAPYVGAALARPEASAEFLLTYALSLVRAGKSAQATELLTGLTKRSGRWTTLPLEVGPGWMADAREAGAWLRICASLVPAGDAAARLRLAAGWGAAWEAFGTPELLAAAMDVLAGLTTGPAATADAHFLRGTLLQLSGDAGAAEASYVAAIGANGNFAGARNNLAMLLAAGGRWEQAVAQAKQAVGLKPKSALYRDTLAFAYRQGKDFGKAIAALDEAIRLEPGNPEWHVSLAEAQTEAGERDRALQTISRIRELDARGVPFPRRVRARLNQLSGQR